MNDAAVSSRPHRIVSPTSHQRTRAFTMSAVCRVGLFFVLGAVFVPVSSAFADGTPLRADTAGNLIDPLNLGSSFMTGTLAPARLGTGTPSSGTVLRGDGTWAATTPTGNTIPATGNLLMGDGAGNASAVVSSADLARVLRMRADTALSLTTLPTNLIAGMTLAIRGGTVNADGTITIPANEYVEWDNPNGTPAVAAGTTLYCYAAATTDQLAGASGFSIIAWYNRGANVGFPGGSPSTPQPAVGPGVSKFVFTNNVGNGGYAVFVNNATSAPLTIYPPVMMSADTGLLAAQSFADCVVVPSLPVADLDFNRFASADRSSRYLAERQTNLAVDSATGADTNAGTLYAPKLTLATQTLAQGSVLGLYRAGSWRDSLPLAGQGTAHGIVVQDLALGSVKSLPVVSGLDQVLNGGVVANGDGTYSYTWSPTNTLTNDGYNNVYIVEINTATEAATPVAARRRMLDVANAAAVVATPGACLVQAFASQWLVQFHPSDSLAPGSGTYRYEVVSRVSPTGTWYTGNTTGDGALSGVQMVGGGSGYGALSGPTGFVGDRLVVLHNTTHSAVLGGGSLQRSIFYEMGDTQSIMLAWYANVPTGLRWTLNDCLFYAGDNRRVPNFLISHSGGSQTYDQGDVTRCAFVGGRLSNGALGGAAFSMNAVARSRVTHSYVSGVGDGFGSYQTDYAGLEVAYNVFRQVGRLIMPDNFHDNLVALESMADPASANNRGALACLLGSNNSVIKNNLFWVHPSDTSGLSNDNSANFFSGAYSGTVTHNIVVLDPPADGTAGYANFGSTSTTPTLDYNLVIQTGGSFGVYFPNYASWADYTTGQPTRDQHSLYVDLRGDPRGINAVFVNAAAGDFRWAQTDVARRCAAYCKANGVGPATVTSRWPVVPSVDDAVRLLSDL